MSVQLGPQDSVVFGTTAGTSCEGNDSRLPTSDEKAALAGQSGTAVNSSNKFVDAAFLGWHTALDLDLSAEQTQDLSADGTYTIGAKTWTRANAALDQVGMVLTNGTGLRVRPKSGCNEAGQWLFPYIALPLSSLGTFHWDTKFRLFVDCSARSGGASNYARVMIAQASGTYQHDYELRWLPSSTAQGRAIIGAAPTTVSFNTSSNIAAIHVNSVLDFNLVGFRAASWPTTLEDMTQETFGHPSTVTYSTRDKPAPSHWFLILGAFGATSDGDFTIARVRLDYRNF